MVVMGILSDCQECMAFGGARSTEDVRKQLNVAKYILYKQFIKAEKLEIHP
jgi:hypothetical protein